MHELGVRLRGANLWTGFRGVAVVSTVLLDMRTVPTSLRIWEVLISNFGLETEHPEGRFLPSFQCLQDNLVTVPHTAEGALCLEVFRLHYFLFILSSIDPHF
jgi:hypothetical protein